MPEGSAFWSATAGSLTNSGPEKIVESYYSFPISVWRATLNYQLITNPAYNRDRGPVSVLGARLRAQFYDKVKAATTLFRPGHLANSALAALNTTSEGRHFATTVCRT